MSAGWMKDLRTSWTSSSHLPAQHLTDKSLMVGITFSQTGGTEKPISTVLFWSFLATVRVEGQ